MSFEATGTYPTLDVAALRHRTEPSRFALAAIACGLIAGGTNFFVLAAYGPEYFLVIAPVVAGALGSLWVLVQLVRIRNLAAAVKVSRETFPEVQDAIDEIRSRLSYRRRTDVYLVDKQTPPVTLASYFGYRVIVSQRSSSGKAGPGL